MASPNLAKDRRYTFKDFEAEFPDDAACLRKLVEMLYPHGIHCLKCGEVLPHHQLKSRPKVWSCGRCGTHTHPTAGTPFHKSRTSLKTWFHAIYLMASTRCGISAMQLMRETGVTYKTAWRMFNLIRRMLLEDVRDMGQGGCVIEADETYFGGRRRGKQNGKFFTGGSRKIAVAGMVERGGRVIAYPVESRNWFELTQPIKERAVPGATIHTDEAMQYNPLKHMGFKHHAVKHMAGVYVDKYGVTTNTIEGFWGNVKRGISGVYHHVSGKYLQAYIYEYQFRYNHRDDNRPMFKAFCAQISTDFVAAHFPEKHRPRKVA